jgi:hypothetical protein
MRRIVLVDAVTCIAMGALLVASGGSLAPLLGLPEFLLQYAGVSLFPIAGFMLWVAMRANPPRAGVWMIVAGNALWVAGSVVLLIVLQPTALGYAFVIVQALAVAVLAELEYVSAAKSAV